MSLIDTLRALAITVRNEKKKEANSAVRIGDLFIAIIDFIKGVQSGEIRQEGVDTYNDTSGGKTSLLNKYPNPELNWTVLVRNDETSGGKASLYKWNGSSWINLETPVYDNDLIKRNQIVNISQVSGIYDYTDRNTVRASIAYENRGLGLILTYQLASGQWVKEQYIGPTINITDWILDNNWIDLGVNRNEFINISQKTGKFAYAAKSGARNEIIYSNRGFGCIISYQMSDGTWITERYKGTSLDQNIWELDNNWEDVFVGVNPAYNASQRSNNYAFETKAAARLAIDYRNRTLGQLLAYKLSTGEWIIEQNRGTLTASANWQLDVDWTTILDSAKIAATLGFDSSKLVSQDLLTRTSENKSHKNERIVLYPNANQSVISCVAVGDDIYDIYNRGNDYVYIDLNGKNITSKQQPLTIGALASCYYDGKIHIIASNANAYLNTNNLINYYTFDIATKELVLVSSLNFDADRRLCNSIIPFNGKLYAVVHYVTTNGTFVNAKAIVELYEVGAIFRKVSNIATPDDIWGYKFERKDGVTNYSLAQTGYYNATLSTDGNNLYCTYVGTPISTAFTSKYLVFTKKSTDAITWLKDEIHSNIRSYSSFVFHYKGQKVYFSKAYRTNAFAYAETDLVFALNGRFNKGYYGILPILANKYGKTRNEYYNIFDNGDEVIIITSFAFADGRANRGMHRFSLSKKEIFESLKGANFKDKGLLSITDNPYIGDSFILDKQGTSNIPIWTFPYAGSTGKVFATLGKNGKMRLTYNGSDLGWTPTYLQTPQSRIDNHAFEHNAQCNPFFSGYFRIPAISESEDGNILYSAGDIRYTRGDDFDIIQVGFCRSLDNGLTWQDHKVIFFRDEQGDYSNRIHDCSLIVDKNPSSPHYGRIWAFSKMWTSDMVKLSDWNGIRYIKFFMCYSDDKGLTWSNQQDVTNIIPDEWLSFSTGCNPGMTLQDGTLLLPMYVTKLEGTTSRSQATFIYSTDNGTTWQLGDIVDVQNTNENSIVQLEDGSLLMNARDETTPIRRVFTLASIGAGWAYKPDYSVIQSVHCNESLVYNRGVYLFSQPVYIAGNLTRKNITIWKSKDLINWEKIIQVTDYQSAGYSNLILTDNRFGILFETANYDIDYANLDYLLPIIYK